MPMRRTLVAVLLTALSFSPAAAAWSWPVDGAVIEPFVFDPSQPYAAGQHRGVDLAAPLGETVAAPVAGSVSFAGTVPGSGRSITIATADGYAVTLTHLGSITTAKGATVAEGDGIGTIGPSDVPDRGQPYVQLGVRVAADP